MTNSVLTDPVTDMKKRRLYIFLLLAAAALFRLICYLKDTSFRLRPDDFGPLTVPAYLAGFDWRPFSSTLPNYYGFGYYWIFAPFFKFIRDPIVLLACIAAVNSVVVVLITLLIYHLLVRYFRMSGGPMTIALSLFLSIYQGDVGQNGAFFVRTDNELPFFALTWVAVWMLLAAREAGIKREMKKWYTLSALLALVLTYALTVHERAMALLISFAVVVLLLFLLKRKWMLAPLPFYACLAAGFVLQRLVRNAVIRFFWYGGWPQKNTDTFRGLGLWFVESRAALKSFLLILTGNLHSLMIQGFGLPAFAIVLVLIYLIRSLSRKKKLPAIDQDGDADPDPSYTLLLIFGVCIAAVICGLAFRWGPMLLPGIENDKVVYAYKGICFSRYFYLFLGPLLMGCITCVKKAAPAAKSVPIASLILLGVIELVFFLFTYPYCVRGGDSIMHRVWGMCFVPDNGANIERKILVSVLLMFFVACAFAVSAAAKRQTAVRILSLITLCMLLPPVLNRLQQVTPGSVSLRVTEGSEAAAVLTRLEEAQALPEMLYVPATKSSCGIQYLKKELKLVGGRPKDEEYSVPSFVVTKEENRKLASAGYTGKEEKGFWYYTNDEAAAAAL